MSPRRRFLETAGLAALALPAGARPAAPATAARPAPVRPARLRPGDTVGLVAPARAFHLRSEIETARLVVEGLGLKPRLGPNFARRYGYLAGRDEERAADVNALFGDPEVKGILAGQGGWGCARLLPHLDFDLIRRNPKVLLGYSDLTALLLAIHARTGLVTFHGPTALSDWSAFTLDWARRVLFEGEAPTYRNVLLEDGRLVPRRWRTQVVTPGRASGRLLGGNLTVLSHLLGTPYLPDFEGSLLFLEDVHEEVYRVDRMLTQLGQAGVLKQARAVAWGTCTDCEPGEGYGALTLEELLDDHVRPLGVPAYAGAMIGHIDDQFTLPLGLPAELDAEAGTLRLLEPAVV